MKVLIVHAHPEPQSFTTAMRDLALETLQGQGHEVQVSDLYAMNWNPVASAADFVERENSDYLVYALEQRLGVKKGCLAADIQSELDKLLWADTLILNFPLYWFSVPAILKGWIDRVLVSGVCYGGKRFYDQGGLSGKRVLVSLTLGRPRAHVWRWCHSRPSRGHVAPAVTRHIGLCGHGCAATIRSLARALYQPRGAPEISKRLSTAVRDDRPGPAY